MATSESNTFGNSLEFASDLLDSYDQLDISKRTYVFAILVPSLVFFALTIVVAVVVDLPLVVRLPIPVLGLLIFAAATVYPKLYLSQRKAAIEKQLHLVMTHMTVLSTTNIDRMEVFRTLAAEEEYGVLAEEIGHVVHIVDTWNQSLDDACRRRAKEVASPALSDFFDRLGYTLGAGQELSDFLLSEQSVMIQNYITIYEGALSNIEVMKELYMSMILSMTFALVFATVLPILTGNDPTATVATVIVLFMFVQCGFYFAIRTMAPYDPVWYHPEEDTAPTDLKLHVSVGVGAFLASVLVVITAGGIYGFTPIGLPDLLFFLDEVPLPLYLAVPISPFLIPGFVLRAEEEMIRARDREFPNFIRALGATESAKQSTTSSVLETLREKDFGPLSPDVDRLYRRLNVRIAPVDSWRLFAIDTRSYLIQKFSEMYVIGRQMGGDPKQLGELISKNMSTVNQLREQRRQATVTLIGLLYGITTSSSFAFFIGLQVVSVLADLSEEFTTSSAGEMDFGQLIYAGVYDIPLIEFLLLMVILFNGLLSSVMIRTIDGGNNTNAYTHFVFLTWLGCLTAIATKALVTAILTV
ncbi:archaellar assembly protein FlaJ [Halogranum rubrum]|uniref:Flagellar assembly protein J n=1 Tax=Halogranum salarium B-1 TaxID=1210908 RepID=J3EYB5_9EURY|nr:archaellar assembly protein FlaJ [Halogranum salarium]EJN60297.1 flagellar assembly protein J [Halogranum salarium B-1]